MLRPIRTWSSCCPAFSSNSSLYDGFSRGGADAIKAEQWQRRRADYTNNAVTTGITTRAWRAETAPDGVGRYVVDFFLSSTANCGVSFVWDQDVGGSNPLAPTK